MKTLWFFEEVNLFSMLCPHKFKAYKQDHDFNTYKKQDYIYFEEDNASDLVGCFSLSNSITVTRN